MTELVALLIIAGLALLQHRADQRRLDDAFAQIAAAQRQLRAQADPQTFYATDTSVPAAEHQPLPLEQFWLTDASGLISVPLDDGEY